MVVQILARFLSQDPESKILMTASTHNGACAAHVRHRR